MLFVAVSAAVCLLLTLPTGVEAAFGGKPPMGPNDSLRYLLRPYDLVKINCLGINYCENLLDSRVNIPSYTHLGFDRNAGDAWHLQFPDDNARLIEGLAFEERFSPVVRLELIRRLMKGTVAAHVPGTQGYYFFRHRSGGKTWMILDDEKTSKTGRLVLSKWGDSIESGVKVGFRVGNAAKWLEMDGFTHTDEPERAGDPGTARSARYWNESPFVFKRHYAGGAAKVEFAGGYWLSDEDKPIEFAFSSPDADRLQIVIGEPGKPTRMFLDNGGAPGVIHLPDRKTTYASDKAGDVTLEKPAFNYLMLRKATAWASPGYSMAILVMWEGRPEKIEAIAANGYGEVRVEYAGSAGKVWLYPFQWLSDEDMEYVFRNAESFLASGRMLLNGFPSMMINNAMPTGLAAGAYVLAKYGDPFAVTARTHAEHAVDALLDPEPRGKKLVRSFFPAKAAIWMLQLGRELGDQRLIDKYTPLVERTVKRMMSPESAYDGKGWSSGWDHFNCAKTLWLAYDATGSAEYKEAFERALSVYTIDEKGIYRYGEPMKEPGGFETYFGALPLGLWGLGGKLDWCEKLINLDVPAGWQGGDKPVKDLWNDTGVGPWAQDDAVVDYIGACLGGAGIPREKKHILPVGAFPFYDAKGNVEVTNQPILENPYFPKGAEKPKTVRTGTKVGPRVKTLSFNGGSAEEKTHLTGGRAEGGKPVIYSFDTKGAAGAGVDLEIEGKSYRVEVSPDGHQWFQRLDSWSPQPRWESVDASFLTGGRDELVKLAEIAPPDDSAYLSDAGTSKIEREHCRYLEPGDSVVYKLSLPRATECRLELLGALKTRIECSPDGKTWREKRDRSLATAKDVPDSGWLHFVDATDCLAKDGSLFVRLSAPTDARAFARRLVAYGSIDSDKLLVKVSGSFDLHSVTLRTWGR